MNLGARMRRLDQAVNDEFVIGIFVEEEIFCPIRLRACRPRLRLFSDRRISEYLLQKRSHLLPSPCGILFFRTKLPGGCDELLKGGLRGHKTSELSTQRSGKGARFIIS